MDYPNQAKLLPNGAEILVEITKEEGVSIIAAHFPLSNHPYVVWTMNHSDRSCYWGHYFSTLLKAYQYLFNKGVELKLIEMEKYNYIEVSCVKWLEEHQCWEQCNIKDKPDLYSTYGRFKTGGASCFSDHYSGTDCITWANWIAYKYHMEVCKQWT